MAERPPATTAAVVLAAGGGTRYDGDGHKLLASFRGRPVVEWAIEAAVAAGLDATYVVTGAVDLLDHVPDGVVVIHNESWAEGQATSLRVAARVVEADGHSAMVVGLGDMPLVEAPAWRAVATADGQLVTATYAGRRSPPTKIAADLFAVLPISGDEGARALMRLRPDLVIEIACPGQPIDIDTRGDLRRWS
jgi:CTP:molybdopterin cytidylyltransferase MocA